MVALLCVSGCLDAPGGSDDGPDAASPADGGTIADGGGSPDADPCGIPFSVAYVDLVHSMPSGESLEGVAMVVAENDPVALGKLEVDAVADELFDAQLTVTSDGVVAPGDAHGGLEASAAGQIALVVDPERWAVLDRPVLTYVIGSEARVPSIRVHDFALVIGAQRADLRLRVRYAFAYEGVTAKGAAIVRSLCVE